MPPQHRNTMGGKRLFKNKHLAMRLILLLFIITALPSGAMAQSSSAEAKCQWIVDSIESMYKANPESPIVRDKIEANLDLLKRQENLLYYLKACNIYIDWLFRHGDLTKSKAQITRIVHVANTTKQPELLAIAMRAQGQFLMRLGFFDAAKEYFEKAYKACPDFRQLNCHSTYASIVIRLIQTGIFTNNPNDADHMLRKLDTYISWLDQTGRPDSMNVLHVRSRALHAAVEHLRGNTKLCNEWMKLSREQMHKGVPRKTYVTYYTMENSMLMAEGKYEQCLAGIDSLRDADIDILPFRNDLMLNRAKVLHKMGRGNEAAEAYSMYINMSDHIDRLVVATQMDLLHTKYKFERTENEKNIAQQSTTIATVVSIILLAMLCTLAWFTVKFRQKNRHLVRLLKEQDKASATSRKPADAHLVEVQSDGSLGAKGIKFLVETKAFNHIDGGRAALAEHFNTCERTVTTAVSAVAGCSFKALTNGMKLEESRRILEYEPATSIGEIASRCGFGTMRTYQSLFKEKYGLSPSEYRANALKEQP